MKYPNGKNVFIILGLFLALFISSCESENEREQTPCGRPDCSVIKQIYSENGVEHNILTQTYTVIAGKKLLAQTHLDILPNLSTITISNVYDNQARLIETTNTTNSTTTRTVYEYTATQPERVTKHIRYGSSNEILGYTMYTYSGTLNKAVRQDNYTIQDEIVSHKEFEYDAAGNITQELDYSGTVLNSRTTYLGYISEGNWQQKLFENFREHANVQLIDTQRTVQLFINCTLKATVIEINGVVNTTFVNTIENDLIVSTQTFDATGNQINNNETIYEYDCD